ncbi:DUF1684 domain-containing protein [Halobacteriaceae bacterium SHR40]|uniref:DUF1684 domain-containing protein n=1 Tax=Halovenus amylolytica TaxID=2500550 RepID=UPI000FE2EFAC
MSDKQEPTVDVGDEWTEELQQNRAEKDEFLNEHRQSPIPPDHRDEFDGLAYFDPDPEYRVAATVHVFDEPETVELETSDGRTVSYNRVFRFTFELDGEQYDLHGYRQAEDDSIFVPFRDKTTGQQSYKDGRYMDLELERELQDGDSIVLDFNLAYSPFCAYSETFSCPLPPEENWLETTIEAGERSPPF